MIKEELVISNELGIHARVVSRIVNEARKFSCLITAKKAKGSFDLKSIKDVAIMGGKYAETVVVEFCGDDEAEAANALKILFEDKFEEK